jgi:two-component system, LytTR family, sensor histidine kinase AlgZ
MPQVKTATWAYWGRILLGNVLASIVVVFAFSDATMSTPLVELLRVFGISFLFSCCIAALLGFTMPHVGPWIWCRIGFPFNWIASSIVMAVLGVVGSVAAIAALTAVGLVKPTLFRDWLASSFRITIVMTLTIGLFIMAYEMMRKRLDDATLALRTKERDESEARRLAAEAQLASIESRVQPHFLFNTLNSIAALVHDDPAGAERMTGQLASLLRSALDSTAQPLVPLDEELRVVRAYLDIERVRFGDRLHYLVDLGEGAASAIVPRMALQTLVENSVKYAVSSRREGGSIRVRAKAAAGRIMIAVEDDGPGFDPATRPEGHGLALLGGRLAMLFGDRASMHVESRPGYSGVTIDLPNDNREKI